MMYSIKKRGKLILFDDWNEVVDYHNDLMIDTDELPDDIYSYDEESDTETFVNGDGKEFDDMTNWLYSLQESNETYILNDVFNLDNPIYELDGQDIRDYLLENVSLNGFDEDIASYLALQEIGTKCTDITQVDSNDCSYLIHLSVSDLLSLVDYIHENYYIVNIGINSYSTEDLIDELEANNALKVIYKNYEKALIKY